MFLVNVLMREKEEKEEEKERQQGTIYEGKARTQRKKGCRPEKGAFHGRKKE
jgi:hypothetical protein